MTTVTEIVHLAISISVPTTGITSCEKLSTKKSSPLPVINIFFFVPLLSRNIVIAQVLEKDMAKNNSYQIYIIVGILLLAGVFLYFYMNGKSKAEKFAPLPNPVVENFTALAAGANNNTGMFLDDSYDLIRGVDHEIPAHHFADMVNQGDLMKEYVDQPKNVGENMRPMERLHRIQGKSLMPRVSNHVTPFNVDVANPTSHKYMVNTPRVSSALKSKYKDYSMSTMIRGDIPITYDPNVCLIAKTTQGRDDLNLAGLFSPYFASLYNKYTGKEYKNLVQKVAGAGQAGGYGGASGGVIMDHY